MPAPTWIVFVRLLLLLSCRCETGCGDTSLRAFGRPWPLRCESGPVKEIYVSEKLQDIEGGDRGNTYSLQSVVKVADVDQLAVQETLVLPSQLLGALLGHQEPRSQLVGLHLEEASQLGEIHGGVEAEVRLDGGAVHVGLDLVHEDGQVVLHGVNVGLGVVKVRRNGGDELGAGAAEQLLKDGQRLGAAALHLEQLVAVLLP